MATATVEFDAPSGFSLRVELYALGSDTAVAIGAGGATYADATEKVNDLGCYSASVVNATSATYWARIKTTAGTTIRNGVLQHRNVAVIERIRRESCGRTSVT